MPTPADQPEEPESDAKTSGKKKRRGEGEPKGRREGQKKVSPIWENRQALTVSEQLRRLFEAKKAEAEKAGGEEWTNTRVGRCAGYADHSQANRYMTGGPGMDDHGFIRVANALDAEVLVVPRGTAESLLARLHHANERELRLLTALADLVLDFRDDETIVPILQIQLDALRAKALLMRKGGS
jgi:hypothetical protein